MLKQGSKLKAYFAWSIHTGKVYRDSGTMIFILYKIWNLGKKEIA